MSGQRERVISFRVTEEEFEEFNRRAKLRGVRVSDLIRAAILSPNLGSTLNTIAAGLSSFREVRYGRR